MEQPPRQSSGGCFVIEPSVRLQPASLSHRPASRVRHSRIRAARERRMRTGTCASHASRRSSSRAARPSMPDLRRKASAHPSSDACGPLRSDARGEAAGAARDRSGDGLSYDSLTIHRASSGRRCWMSRRPGRRRVGLHILPPTRAGKTSRSFCSRPLIYLIRRGYLDSWMMAARRI